MAPCAGLDIGVQRRRRGDGGSNVVGVVQAGQRRDDGNGPGRGGNCERRTRHALGIERNDAHVGWRAPTVAAGTSPVSEMTDEDPFVDQTGSNSSDTWSSRPRAGPQPGPTDASSTPKVTTLAWRWAVRSIAGSSTLARGWWCREDGRPARPTDRPTPRARRSGRADRGRGSSARRHRARAGRPPTRGPLRRPRRPRVAPGRAVGVRAGRSPPLAAGSTRRVGDDRACRWRRAQRRPVAPSWSCRWWPITIDRSAGRRPARRRHQGAVSTGPHQAESYRRPDRLVGTPLRWSGRWSGPAVAPWQVTAAPPRRTSRHTSARNPTAHAVETHTRHTSAHDPTTHL